VALAASGLWSCAAPKLPDLTGRDPFTLGVAAGEPGPEERWFNSAYFVSSRGETVVRTWAAMTTAPPAAPGPIPLWLKVGFTAWVAVCPAVTVTG
jgi:hypothetical protein